MADKTVDETVELSEGEEETVDLGGFSDEDLAGIHSDLVQQYSALRSGTVELSEDEDAYTNLAEVVEAIEFVRAEMEGREALAEVDAAIEEGAEFASNFAERMKALRAKKGGKAAPDAEDVADKGADEATENMEAVESPTEEKEEEKPDASAPEFGVGRFKKLIEAGADAPTTEEYSDTANDKAVAAEEEAKKKKEEAEYTEGEGDEGVGLAATSSEELAASNTVTTSTNKAHEEATVTASSTLSPAGLPSDRAADVVEEVVAPQPNVIRASADIPGFAAGAELNGLADMATAFVNKHDRIRGTDKGNDGYRYLIASIEGNFPEDDSRFLNMNTDANMEKIKAVTSPEAITASGGFCAPLTPYYSLLTLGDAVEPVRDSLPNFKADRGGIRFMPPPRLSDVVGSVRRTTAAQDAAGYTNQNPAGTTAPKPSLHVTCLSEQAIVVEAISRSLTFGNLGSRTFPEQVEAWIKLSLVQFARYSEIDVLDAISANSTPINAAPTFGPTSALLEQVSRALAAFKYRHRIANSAKFRAIFPVWSKALMASDLSFQAPGDGLDRMAVSDAQLEAWFLARGVSVTWHDDNTTASGAPFGTQNAGPLLAWPPRVEWFLFPEGSFLYLDGGSIDLGLVRDSTLNSQNDYQIWAERFQGVAFVGIESYRVESHVCVNGDFSRGTHPDACSGS